MFSLRHWLREAKKNGSFSTKARQSRRFRPQVEDLEHRVAPAVRIWDGVQDLGGATANANWTTAGNWVGDIAPEASDDLVFAATAARLTNVNDFAAGTRFNTITISGSGYSISGSAIELYGGLTANNATGTNTFGLNTTLVNAQTIMSANAAATLNFTGTISTGNLVGTTNFVGTSALTFDGSGTTNASGIISGAGSVTKLGAGTVILGGANTYAGITDVRQGVARVTNNTGLGSAATGHTEVQAGAALQVSGGITVAEQLAIREAGVGFGSGTDPNALGALRSVGGANTWTGAIQLAGTDNVIGVDAGSSLNVSGKVSAVTNTAIDLVKVGGGTLRFSGSEANVYTGSTTVLRGTLELAKTAGQDAIGGDLIIGDNIGGDNAAVVKLLASDQIRQLNFFDVALTTITLNSSGVLDFNGFSDTVGNLVLTTGTTYSADIDLNGGTLTLGGASITLNALTNPGGGSGLTPAATIQDGTLNIGGFFSGAGGGVTKTIAVNDTQLTNVATDLNISATVAGAAGVSLTKTGGGTLRLANNTFAGPFIATAGIVEVAGDTAFGNGLVSLQNATLRAIGARTVANAIGLDGTVTFFGDDALTFTGAATLSGGRTLQVMDPDQVVTFAGGIGESIYGSQSLNKGGRGTLALTGTNTYSGATTTNTDGGTLVLSGAGTLLNTSGITVGLASTLRIDNNAGGNVADRLNDLTGVTMNGGRLHFVGSGTASSGETVGAITPNQNVTSVIEVENTSAGAFNSLLTASALTLATVTDRPMRFVGTGVALSASGPNRLSFVNNPGNLTVGILPLGIVQGPGGTRDFATYGSSAEGIAIIPLPESAYVTDINQASATSNVRVTANTVLTTSKVVNALLIDDGVVLSGPGATLTVNSGNIVLGDGAGITTTNLNMGAGLINVPTGTATISSSIVGGTLQKGGTGTLVLSGNNQYTGGPNINEGVLRITHNNALGAPTTTSVRANAALELDGSGGNLTILAETLTLEGTGGPGNPGALRNIAGNNSFAGNISLGGVVTNLTDELGGFPVLTNSTAVISVAAGSSLNLSGAITGVDLVKKGEGLLEFSGVTVNGYGTTRIFDGTVLLNKEPGLTAVQGTIIIGDDGGDSDDTLRLAGSDQLQDAAAVTVNASGVFDLNGNSDVMGTLNLVLGTAADGGAGDVTIGTGGMLTTNGNIVVQTQGVGNAAGATITGGTLALQLFGTVTTPGTRNWQVNDGAAGTDLVVTSSVIDGTGLQSIGIVKDGFGALELGGSTANSLTGTTTVNDGTLLLNKTGGTALSGPLTIGNNNLTSGYAGSDVVRLLQANQLADFLAPVTVTTTGLLDLNGFNETIGVADAQNALSLQAGSTVATGGGTLTINGNIVSSAANGAGSFTPIVAPTISGNLNLGSVPRTIDTGGDRTELPFELDLSANVSGAGLLKSTNNGTLLLSGNNTYSGNTFVSSGNLALGSDTALGSSIVYLTVGTSLLAYNDTRSIANTFYASGSQFNLLGGNNVGGGGNTTIFTGNFNGTGGTITINTAVAGTAEFRGGVGETFSATTLNKSGFGTLVLSGINTYSGSTTINSQGGTLVLRDQGTILNATSVAVNSGGTLQFDNSGVNLTNRFGDTAGITLTDGALAFVGKSGAASSEMIGTLTLNTNTANEVHTLVSPVTGSAAVLSIGSLTRNANSFVTFVSRGRDLSRNEIQTLTVPTTVTTFNVSFNGSSPSAALTRATLTAAQLQAALEALPTVGVGNVTVTGATAGPYTIAFKNALAASNLAPVVATLLTGTGPPVVAAVAEGNHTGSTILFNTAPAVSGTPGNEILPYATVRSTSGQLDYATIVGNVASLQAFTNYSTGSIDAAAPGSVYLLTSDQTVTANNSLAAVLMRGDGLDLLGSAGVALTLTAGGLVSTGAGNTVSVPTLTLGAEGIFVTAPTTNGAPGATLNVSSAVAGAVALTTAGSGTLIMSGANASTFTGAVVVTEGVFSAQKDTAFGTAGGNNVVTYGGTVELSGGITFPAEQITLNGSGEGTLGSVPLRSVSGTNTWLGNVALNTNRTGVEVVTGNLVFGGAGVVSSNALSKLGSGTLQLGGTAANTFTGDNQQSVVWQGTLELAKTAGTAAIRTPGTNVQLIVGDHVGGAGADNLVFVNGDQIPDAVVLTVNSSGRWDLNGQNETINGFTLVVGPLGSASVGTGSGTLTTAGNVTLNVVAGGTPTAATIAGKLALQVDAGAAATRTFTVNDSAAINDLVVTAVISDGDNNATNLQGITKAQAGRMVLDPGAVGNTFTGVMTVSQGELAIRGTNALGDTAAAGNTVVSAGAGLLLDGAGGAENLNLTGTGLGGRGALVNLSGNNTLSGPITLAAASTVGAAGGTTLTLSGGIAGAVVLTKLLPGTLVLGGGAGDATANAQSTTVAEGKVTLNKAAGTAATATLVIGNDAGGNNADMVELARANQILGAAAVTVTSSGQLNLNGNNETLSAATALTLTFGPTYSANVDTGAGTLALGGNVTVNSTGATTSGSPGAAITGKLDLGAAARTLTVNQNTIGTRELELGATVSNGAGGSVLKNGAGTLALTADNSATLTGHVTNLSAGTLALGHAGALGNAASSLNVTAAAALRATTALTDAHNIALNADLTIRGDQNLVLNGTLSGIGAATRTLNVTVNQAATVTLGGTLNLSSDAATSRLFVINDNTFNHSTTLSGNIRNGVTPGATGPFHTFQKGGVGTLQITSDNNSGANTDFVGNTTVAGGILRVTNNNALGGVVAEQQTFAVTTTAAGGGSFTITYNGQTTTALSYTGSPATTPPDAATVAAALNALPSIARTGGLVTVTSSNPAGPTTTYTVTFGGSLAGVDVTQIASINITAPVSVSTAIATPLGGTGGTFVNNGGTLQVIPGLNIAEPLTLNNNGFGNFGALRLIDATPGVAETATWAGNVNFNANSTWVGVDGGGANPDRLVITGTVVSGGAALIVKTGAGEVEFGGNTDNGQVVFNGVSPNDDGLEIRQGTVYFNKPQVAGINYQAIVGAGRVTVGDGGGGAGADRLVLIGSSLDQIGGTVPVTVGPSGLLSLNAAGAAAEQLPATLTLQRLMGIAGAIDTGTRALVLNGTLDVSNAGVTTGSTPAATIAGFLNLTAAGGGATTRTFTANDSYVLDAADDLVISAVIDDGDGNANLQAVTKDGAGTLVLTAANTYTGTTTVNSTTLDFNTAGFNNGTNALVGGTLLVRGAGTLGTGNVTVNSGATLTLDNSTATANRIADAATLTLAGGTVNLIGQTGTGSLEVISNLTLNAGTSFANRVQLTSDGTNVTELRATTLTRGAGGTVHFVGVGDAIDNTTTNRIQITTTNPLVNNVLPYGTIEGPGGTFDLVTDGDATNGAPFFVAAVGAGNLVSTYNTSVNAGGVVRVSGGTDTLTTDRTVDALLLENGATVDGAFMLTVGTATSGLVVARTGSNAISATGSATNPGVQFAAREPLFLVESGSSLNVSSTINSSAAARKERGGALTLSGDNDAAAGRQLTGAFTINGGTVIATHGNALGAEAVGTVTVNRRAALVLDATAGNLDFGNKAITLNGYGLNDDLASNNTARGSLRVIGGTAAAPRTVTVGTNPTIFTINQGTTPNVIDVTADTTLNLLANVTGNNNLTKIGAGTLVYGGDSQNASTGTISVNEGTLRLNKTAGTGPVAVRGALTVNDLGNLDTVGSAAVIYTAGVPGDQIGAVAVAVNDNGTFDYNGASDTIGALTVAGGSVINTAGGGTFTTTGLTTSGGTINTGTGSLILNGNATYNSGFGGTTPATIAGNLDLAAATRTITVNDGTLLNELTIDAMISNGRLVKAGNGGLLLNNAGNTFLPGINEVQRILITGATAGTTQFNINFNGNVTTTITVDAVDTVTAAAIEAALRALPNVGTGGVSVATTAAGTFDITFTGHLGEQDVPSQVTTTVVTAPGTFTPSTVTGGVAGINHTAGILSVGSNTALGSARVQLGNATPTPVRLIATGGDRTLANNLVLLNQNAIIVFGGQRDFGGTFDLNLTGGVTLHSSTGTGQNVNLDVLDTQTVVTMSGVISGGGNFIVPTKRGIGTLIWSGNNTFDVRNFVNAANLTNSDGIRLEGGILRVAHSNALGTSAESASVLVRGDVGAVLEIDGTTANGPVNITGRVLDIAGVDNGVSRGFLNRSSTGAVQTGILRNLGGANSIVSPNDQFRLRNIADGANPTTLFFGVDAGSLNLNGALTGLENDATPTVANNRTLTKVGAGTLRTSGGANTITSGYNVLEGVLELNKTTGPAVAGTLSIGDNVGGNNSAEVRYVAGAAAGQVGAVAVNIAVDGLLNLNGYAATTDTLGAVTLIVGETSSADIVTGAATTNLDFASLTVTGRPGINAAVAATITGGLNFAAARTLTVNDSPGDVELTVSAVIAQSVASVLTKGGAGRLVLSGNNTYDGAATISAGALRIQHINALGSAVGTTTVATNAALEIDLAGTNTIAEPLILNGSGIVNGDTTAVGTTFQGSGAYRNLQGTNTWSGAITLNTNPVAIDVSAGRAVLSGVISGANGLAKVGGGILELAGGSANTYTGQTSVNAGTLVLNKSVGPAVNGALVIGDNIGIDNADQVVYAATAAADQILNTANVTVLNTGLLNLAGQSDTITALTLTAGPTAGDVSTGAGTLTLGGNVTVVAQAGTAVAATISGLLDLGGAIRTLTVTDSTANEELIVSAAIGTGAFGVTKAGRGTMTLSGASTYSGATTLNTDSGTLLVTGSIAAGGGITVNPNSTLGGTGTINSAVILIAAGSNLLVGGILSPGTPGDDTGILTVNDAVTFNAGARFNVDIDGAGAAGTDYDQLAVTGAVAINTGAVLAGSRPPTNLPNSGLIRIINHTVTGTIGTGTFSNELGLAAPNPLIIDGKTYTPDYANAADGVGADLVLTPIAGIRVWDGDAADDNWSTDRNWVGDASPFVGDELVFNDVGVLAGANPFNDLVGFVASRITLANTTGSYDLLGNVVAVTTGVFAAEGATASNTITQDLTGTAALAKTGAGTLTIAGADALTGGTTVSAGTLRIGAGGTTGSVAGTIIDNATVVFDRSDAVTHAGLISGTGQVIKRAANTLTLLASNTYSGGTVISAGTLQTNNSSGVGSGAVTLGDANTGSSDVAFLASAVGLTFANDFAVSASGTGAAVIGTADGLTGADTLWSGALTLNRGVTLRAGSDDRTTFAGRISGAGGVTVTGSAPTSRVVLAQPTATVNTFAGDVLVNSGALQLLGPAANQFIPDASGVTVASGAALWLSLTPGANGAETVGALNGAGTVTAQDGAPADVFTLTVGGGGGSGTFDGLLQDSATGTLALVKAGAGTQTLTNTNTYSGGTVISAGTLQTNNSSGVGSGAVTLGDANTGSSDVAFLASAVGLTFANDFAVSASGTGAAVIGTADGLTGADTLWSGALTLNRGVTLRAGSDDRTTFAGRISGAGGVTVTGSAPTSRVVLAQPTATVNTFAGDVLVNSGALQLLGPAANQFVPDASGVTVASGAALWLSLTPGAGGAETVGALNGAGTVTAQDGAPADVFTLTVGGGGGSGTFDGLLQDSATGTLALVKAGAGTQTLTNTNTYSGGTVISAGTLQTNNTGGSGLGTGAVTVASGATLGGTGAFTGAATVTGQLAPGPVTGVLSTGPLSFGSGGVLALDLNTFTPGTGHDQVAVTGTVNLTGSALTVSASAFNVDDTFIIIANDGADAVGGTFASGATLTTSRYVFSINYAGGDGNDVVLTVATVLNAPPVNTVPAGPLTVAEDGTLPVTGVSVGDPDAGSAPIVVTLSVLQGTLTTTTTPGVAVVGTGTNQLTLTGSVANLNSALATLVYRPNADYFGPDTLTVLTNDQGNTGSDGPKTDTDTVDIIVTEVNDPPVATNDVLSSVPEDSGPRTIPLASLLANDSPGPANESAQSLTIISVGNAVGGTVTIVGTDVIFTPLANFNGTASFDYTVRDNGTTNGSPDFRTAVGTVTYPVTAVNDAPVITIASGSVSYTEAAPPVVLAASLILTDVDNTTLTGATVQITGGLASSEDVLAFTPVGNITGSYDAMTGTLTLGGTDTVANYRTALRSVTYINPTGIVNTNDRTITVTATDGTDTSAAVTRTVTIIAFNGAPVNGVPSGLPMGLLFASEDTPLTITGFSVTDNDAGAGTIVTTLSVTRGVLTVSTTAPGGLTTGQVSGNTSRSVTLTGTRAAVNATLAAGLVYLLADIGGPDTLTISTNDQGNTGGPAMSDADQITIAVREVNDAPTAFGDSLSPVAASSGTRSIPLASLIANDVRGPSDELIQTLTVVSVGNAVGGTVTLSGDAALFTPTPGFTGTASFTYTISDNGTTNGLADPKTATGTVNFTVTAGAGTGGVSTGTGRNSAPVPKDPAFAIGLGAGLPAFAALFSADGSLRFVVNALPGFTGGVSAAAGDVNADGRSDLIVGLVFGGFVLIEVFDGNTGNLMSAFFAAPTTASTVLIGASDVNGDGAEEIFIGPVIGLPVFAVFDGLTRSFVGLSGTGDRFLGR